MMFGLLTPVVVALPQTATILGRTLMIIVTSKQLDGGTLREKTGARNWRGKTIDEVEILQLGIATQAGSPVAQMGDQLMRSRRGEEVLQVTLVLQRTIDHGNQLLHGKLSRKVTLMLKEATRALATLHLEKTRRARKGISRATTMDLLVLFPNKPKIGETMTAL